MKKIFVILVLVMTLSSCTADLKENDSTDLYSEQIDVSNNLTSEYIVPKPDLTNPNDLQIMIESIFSINQFEFSGITWTAYEGFNDPSELSSSSLMSYFIFYWNNNPTWFYDEKLKQYYISEEDVLTFLEYHFEKVDFNLSDTIYWDKQKNGTLFFNNIPSEHPDLSGEKNIVSTSYDEINNTITIDGYLSNPVNSDDKSGFSFKAEFYVKNGNYHWKRFLVFEESEDYVYHSTQIENFDNIIEISFNTPSTWFVDNYSGNQLALRSSFDNQKLAGSFGIVGNSSGNKINNIPDDVIKFGDPICIQNVEIEGHPFYLEKSYAGSNGTLEAHTYYFVEDGFILQFYFLKPINENWEDIINIILKSLTVSIK